MQRTKLNDRILPDYNRTEENMNMITHIVGAASGIIILAVCLILSIAHDNIWAVVSSAIYGFSMIALYTVSSIYHGLHVRKSKKVMQVIDHCTIFFLIAGTYTPILLVGIRPLYPALAWWVFGAEFGLAALGIVLNAIDLKKYKIFSMICYLLMGWLIIFTIDEAIEVMTKTGFMWLLAGGISFTIGAVLYGIGKKKRYIHSVFHILVVIGTTLQAVCIIFYII